MPPQSSRSATQCPSSYKNEFRITLDDKSKFVLVVETDKQDDLQSASGIHGTLYNGCLSHHPSSKKLVLDLYPRTQIIADARIV